MRKAIETAPRNGVFVILEDATHGTFAVARWSTEAAQWRDDDDKTVQFDATHWHLPQSLDEETKPPRPDAANRHPPDPVGSATAQPQAIAQPARPVAGGPIFRRSGRIAALVACFVVGAAAGPLLYLGDAGGRLLDLTTADSDIGLKRALEQEQERTNKLVGELAVVRQDAEARASSIRQASEGDLSGLRQALQLEQSRTEQLAGQLVDARRDGAAQTARTRDTMDDAAKERDRVIGELRQALTAQEIQTTETRRRMEAETAQAKQAGLLMAEALQQERDRVGELRLALAAARREAEAQAAGARTASDDARRSANASKQKADEQSQTLREAQSKMEKLATELAAVRREGQAQAALVESATAEAATLKEAAERSADAQQRALQQERDKTGKLTAELGETKSSLQALTKANAADDDARANRLATAQVELQKARADAAAVRVLLQAERTRAEQAEQQLVAPQAAAQGQEYRSQAPAAPAVARSSAASLSTADARIGMPVGDTLQAPKSVIRSEASVEQSGPHPVRLIARAHLLLDQGNIGAARNMLDRAAEMGSAEALFWLAETYDPLLLPARNTLGTQSDIAKARELYDRALAAGVSEARLRLESLEK